jgi:hypothetical protein
MVKVDLNIKLKSFKLSKKQAKSKNEKKNKE